MTNWGGWDKPEQIKYETVGLIIQVTNGWPRIAVVKQVGQLGIEWYDTEFNIHHIPTLYSFNSAVPDGDWTEDQLLKWCWKVQQDHKGIWEVINLTRKQFNANDFGSLLDELKEFCLSTKVG